MNVASYVGVPYDPGKTDCWCLVRQFAKEQLGFDYPSYFYDVDKLTTMAELLITEAIDAVSLSGWTKVGIPEVGDVLIFYIAGKPTHCGIYVGEGQFLHTLEGKNSTVEHVDGWRKRLVGAYRWTN